MKEKFLTKKRQDSARRAEWGVDMKNIVLGLTGQSGAGKTTLCEYLQQIGCTVIDADQIARDVVEKGSSCIADIALEFGCEYLTIDGNLNRSKMAQTVFTDKAKLKQLNAIMFPYIIEMLKEKIDAAKSSEEGIIVLDAPTLFESGADRFCDRVLSVVAPAEIRLSRIIQRDGLSEEEASNRIHAQHDEQYYVQRSWCVISNIGDRDALKVQADNMTSRLRYLLQHDEEQNEKEEAEQENEENTEEAAKETASQEEE